MPAKYLQIGNKYYLAGDQGGQLEQTTEQDIRGRMGDISGATYDRFGVSRGDWRALLQNEAFSGGGIQNIDPSSITFGEQGEVNVGGQRLNLGGSGASVKPGSKVEDFGGLPMNQDFAGYLKETGQTYDPTKGFSGNAQQGITGTQATQQGQQAGTINPTTGQPISQSGVVSGQPGATGGVPSIPVSGKFGSIIPTTPAQPTNANNGVYKDANNNVFEMGSNRPVALSEFKQRGLNIDHINQLNESIAQNNPPSGPVPVDPAAPKESQATFEDDVARVIKESGLNDFKTERKSVLDKLQELQDKKNAEILEAKDNPWVVQGLLDKEVKKIEARYELKENTYANLLKYYDATIDSSMELMKFKVSGIQEDRNKALDRALKREEAEQALLKEFRKESEKKYGAGIIGEYQYAVEQGYKGTFDQYQNEDVNRKSKVAAAGVPKPLSGEASKTFAIAQTLVPEINKLKEAFRGNFKGSIAGYVSGTDRVLVKLIDNVADKVGRLRSGGAINKDEEERFKRQIASYADLFFANENDVMDALDGILAEANLVSQGIDPAGVRSTTTNQPKPIINLSEFNFKFK